MRFALAAAVVLTLLGSVASAQAGCITGAIVGGVAGHMVGHGKVGAAAGCAVGHHNAVKDKQQATPPANNTPPK